ncbi:uncharacterized protein F5147DRAFT_647422 [Suillus discolor]|uniref:Uncharacterized protein n=1 Tax=Suillus discolor TaxID=1912936 RepID=A0A9P7K076_9AGAM|nr:uncharacterized protein F5147DRAFT_647422 [Suillus discolor]KAG2119464.1 hypothetical protein F5147DRAFT_647422 [Suillus discolor]
MPSSEVLNKAFNEVTAGMLQILARALQLTEGPAGHLNMATEMANIMTLAFQSHARSATEIPPILLSVAMELMEHVDRVGQTSFLSVPVWNNIKSDDPRIERHQLYGKAHKAMTASAPAPMSRPADTPPVNAATNTLAVPSVVAKSKLPGSDKVEIVGDITQGDALHKQKRRSTGASEEVTVCHEDKVIAPAIVDKAEDVAPGNTNTMLTRPRPKPKSKQVEIVVSSGSEVPTDRKGKGKEVTLLVETDQQDRGRKKSRDVSSGGLPKKGSNHPPQMQNTGDQRKPWYEIQKRVSTRTATRDQQKGEATFVEQKAMVAPEPVGTMSTVMQADVNANTPIAAIPHMPPPRPTQSPPSFAKDMVIDVSGDTVARDLQAMTLEDTDIRAMEKMCAEIAILQEEVKALHAKPQTREGQIRSTESMLTAQGNRTAVLMNAYESIRQRVVPSPPVPHFNNAVFFPPTGHTVPYSQGMSAGQAQAMERLYFNFTPGPSTIAGASIPSIAATRAGPSGSQINQPSSESASGKGPTT